MPRYFFHVKRGQVTILDQNGLELGGLEEAEAEAKRRLAIIRTWLTAARSSSPMTNGAPRSSCRSSVARASAFKPKATARPGLIMPKCSPALLPRQPLAATALDKKERAPVRGEGAQASAQCWCGSAELINITTILGHVYSRSENLSGRPGSARSLSASTNLVHNSRAMPVTPRLLCVGILITAIIPAWPCPHRPACN